MFRSILTLRIVIHGLAIYYFISLNEGKLVSMLIKYAPFKSLFCSNRNFSLFKHILKILCINSWTTWYISRSCPTVQFVSKKHEYQSVKLLCFCYDLHTSKTQMLNNRPTKWCLVLRCTWSTTQSKIFKLMN